MPQNSFKGWDEIESPSVSREELDESFEAVMAKATEIETAYISTYRHKGKTRLRRIAAYAAVIAALIITPIISAVYIHNHRQASAIMSELSAGKGETKVFMLPDGSKAVLNAESVLFCPDRFAERREVCLSGEAVFDVVADSEHPFVVKTSEMSVQVLGTRFNVNAYSDGRTVSATLDRGSVKVFLNDSPEEAVILSPGECWSYDKESGKADVRNVDPEEVLSWQDGNVCFRSQSIHEVFSIMERKFNVTIYMDSEKYDKALLTAKFMNGESLVEMMDAICLLVPGMSYTMENNRIYIK